MIESVIKLLNYYKGLGEKTFDQLEEEELFIEPAEEANSIAVIVMHLHGNMRSRWTNFLVEDGEKEWRDRDGEFRPSLTSREEVIKKWDEGWSCFLNAIESLEEDDLEKIVYIRKEEHTVLEAIHRQVAHYAYHIGQIVFLGKIIKGEAWQTLSIARNKSEEFNEKKFAEEVGQRHFTDEA